MGNTLDIKTNVVFDYLQNSKEKITVMQGGSRCFAGNQKVVTDKGNVNISKLKIGDKVLSCDTDTGFVSFKKVIDTSSNIRKTYTVFLNDGTRIECTPDHRFWYNGEWTQLSVILADWLLWEDDNYEGFELLQRIDRYEINEEPIQVFDIEVEDNHCFYLAVNDDFHERNNILVHNSGKTYNILIWFLLKLYNQKNKVFTICRASLPSLKGSVLRDFVQILDSWGMYDESLHNKSENTYIFRNNLIEFISIDQPQKIRGRKRDYLFANEGNELPYDAWFQLLVRMSSSDGSGDVKAVMDFNPSFAFHWIESKLLTRPDVDFFKTTYKDNPFLDEATIKEIEGLKDLDENYWRVYGLGEKGNVENVIYSHYDIIDRMPVLDDYCYGIDFGFNHPMAVTKIGFKDDEHYAKEILYESKLTTDDLLDVLSANNVSPYDELYCDAAEPDRIETLVRNGYNAIKADKSVKAGIDYIKNHKLHITKDSVNLIKELQNYKWKTIKDTDIVLDEPVKFMDDAVDSMRYGIYSRAKQTEWSSIFF